MKSRPYPIPYPADPGIDSGPAVGHQQQAVREDIPRIGFPEDVEQKTSQYGNEADVDVEPIRAKSIRAMPIRAKSIRTMPIRAMPVRTELIRTMPIRTKSIRAMPIRTELIRTELIRAELIRHVVRSAPCGMPRRLVSHVPDNFRLPTFLKTVDTEYQHAQI